MIWLLLASLVAVGYPTPPPPPAVFQQAQQVPDRKPLPAHAYGPHHNEPHAFCSRQKTFTHNGDTYYECHCDFICEMGAGGEKLQREADNCVTACGEDQCLCHECESCDQPDPPR